MNPGLKMQNLSVEVAGKNLLKQMSLDFENHQLTCIIGPNGAGKSTLLKAIIGFMKHKGEVFLNGQNRDSLSSLERARSMAYLPQSINPPEDSEVRHFIALGRYPHGGRQNDPQVDDAMNKMDIIALQNRSIHTLSGGEFQRACLASVLCQEPRFLLLDEPDSGLDIHHKAALFKHIRNLSGKDLTILCITHDISLASHFAHQLILMHEGSIICQGTPEHVMSSPEIKEAFGSYFDWSDNRLQLQWDGDEHHE